MSAMEVEARQAELVEQFVVLAKTIRGRSAAKLIDQATSHPSLFAFAELLSMPHIVELQNTEYASSVNLLKLFAYGTWKDYKENASGLPQMSPEQQLKLKQLTVLTLAENKKVLSYNILMREIDIANVRDLEDFLINDCMYVGIVKAKLDQCRRCVEVSFAAGRDLRPGQLEGMIETLGDWLMKSEALLNTIQEKVKWADNMSELDKLHKKEVQEKAEEIQKHVRADSDVRAHQELSFMETGPMVVNYLSEERVRPKRRR